MTRTCVVAAPRPEYLRSLKRALEPHVEVVAMPDNPLSLLEAVRVLESDLVVVDVVLFGADPWRALARLRGLVPRSRLVALVPDEDPEDAVRAKAARLDGVVPRGRAAARLPEVLRELLGDPRGVGAAGAGARPPAG